MGFCELQGWQVPVPAHAGTLSEASRKLAIETQNSDMHEWPQPTRDIQISVIPCAEQGI